MGSLDPNPKASCISNHRNGRKTGKMVLVGVSCSIEINSHDPEEIDWVTDPSDESEGGRREVSKTGKAEEVDDEVKANKLNGQRKSDVKSELSERSVARDAVPGGRSKGLGEKKCRFCSLIRHQGWKAQAPGRIGRLEMDFSMTRYANLVRVSSAGSLNMDSCWRTVAERLHNHHPTSTQPFPTLCLGGTRPLHLIMVAMYRIRQQRPDLCLQFVGCCQAYPVRAFALL